MTIENAEFTFGIEIELVKFDNGEPIVAKESCLLWNEETDQFLWGETTFVQDKNNRKVLDVIGIDLDDGDKIYPIDLTSNGSILPPWKSSPHAEEDQGQFSGIFKDGSAIKQAQGLLDQNGLQGWKADYDNSLTDKLIDAIELVSPVLKFGDFDSINRVCDIFSDITKIDQSCGLHVHIGIENSKFQYEWIRKFMRSWVDSEPKIHKHPSYKDEVKHAYPIRWSEMSLTELHNSIRNSANLSELRQSVNPRGRQHLINLYALDKHGTLEFRGFRSSLNFDEIVEIIGLCESKVREIF